MLKLYDYARSSAAYRVRIALNLKSATYEQIPVNIRPGSDEQMSDAYRARNPQMRVPSLEHEGRLTGQSMAILEWLEETIPTPSILPTDPWRRLQCRAFADTIACDIHPLNNLSVLAALRADFGADQAAVNAWYASWITRGFAALETLAVALPKGIFLFGDHPTLADITLIPQIANARRFNVPVTAYPRLIEIEESCMALDAFQRAAPEAQKDYVA